MAGILNKGRSYTSVVVIKSRPIYRGPAAGQENRKFSCMEKKYYHNGCGRAGGVGWGCDGNMVLVDICGDNSCACGGGDVGGVIADGGLWRWLVECL